MYKRNSENTDLINGLVDQLDNPVLFYKALLHSVKNKSKFDSIHLYAIGGNGFSSKQA